jgi:RNA polymerase sigma-70 factor (ECF subfamily)
MKVRRRLTADERALLETLLREVGPRLLGYARKAFGSRIDAEEIVAETFARAADNVAVLGQCERKDLYLLTIARNLCRDAFRRARPNGAAERELADCANPGPAVHEVTAVHEERERLLAAVGRLSPAQREVVVLRLSAELKFEEIAAVLGIPLGTALSRMDAALRQLRKDLGYVRRRETA